MLMNGTGDHLKLDLEIVSQFSLSQALMPGFVVNNYTQHFSLNFSLNEMEKT
jgi:hypothetical protein